MTEAERIAREVLPGEGGLIGSFQGGNEMHPAFKRLNALGLIHLDVLKSATGELRRWKSRATPLGEAVRHHLLTEKRDG